MVMRQWGLGVLALVAMESVWAQDTLQVHTGVRQDALQWSIAGPPGPGEPWVNVLSELTWKEVRSINFGVDYHNGLKDPIGANIRFNYGVLMDGKNQDSDYDGDNRTKESNRSYSDADDGHVLDVGFSLGPNLRAKRADGKLLVLRPVLGYSYHNQEYRMTRLVNVIPSYYTFNAPAPYYHALYNASWYGPFIGGELYAGLASGGRFKAAFGWHFAQYEGRADWVLRDDFAHPLSFKHVSNKATGKTISLGLESRRNKQWVFGGVFDMGFWEAQRGDDITYWADGGSSTIPFNGAEWTTYMLRLTAQRAF